MTQRGVPRDFGDTTAHRGIVFINEDELMRIQPDAHLDESGFLSAFDSNRVPAGAIERLNGMAPADETYDGAQHRFVS